MKNEKFILSGNYDYDVFLTADDLGDHFETLMGCYHTGACDDDVEVAKKYFDIKDYQKAFDFLEDCGIERERLFESDSELCTNLDHDVILSYYLWILAGDMQDYFKANKGE